MTEFIKEKQRLFKELYDVTFVLNKEIKNSSFDDVVSLIDQRETLIREIDKLPIYARTKQEFPDEYENIKGLMLKIQALDESNSKEMNDLLIRMEEDMVEGMKDGLEAQKARKVFARYSASVNNNVGNRIDKMR